MDLTLTEDQRILQDAARELLHDNITDSGAAAVVGTDTGFCARLWATMTGLGWQSLAIPEEHGGLGAGFVEVCLLIEELGRAGIPSPFLVSACAASVIARSGDAPHRAEHLDAIRDGAIYSCVADGITATASGGEVVLEGVAMFVPYARHADRLLVVTGDRGSGRRAVVAVGDIGDRCERLDVVGTEPLYRVDLSGVRVPAEHVLGGEEFAGGYLEHLTVATCAAMVGGAQGVLERTVGYANARSQFGKPIATFQAVQHHCADMAVDVLGARLATYEAAWELGRSTGAVSAVSVAKAWTTEAYERVCAHGHQVHGAIGFTYECELHWYLRHYIAASQSFGDADFHYALLQEELGL